TASAAISSPDFNRSQEASGSAERLGVMIGILIDAPFYEKFLLADCEIGTAFRRSTRTIATEGVGCELLGVSLLEFLPAGVIRGNDATLDLVPEPREHVVHGLLLLHGLGSTGGVGIAVHMGLQERL